jgi:hypothetical protein
LFYKLFSIFNCDARLAESEVTYSHLIEVTTTHDSRTNIHHQPPIQYSNTHPTNKKTQLTGPNSICISIIAEEVEPVGLATGLEVGVETVEGLDASSPPPQTQHAWFAVAPLFSYMSPNFAQLLFKA